MRKKSLLIVSVLLIVFLLAGVGIAQYLFSKQIAGTGSIGVEVSDAKMIAWGDVGEVEVTAVDYGTDVSKNYMFFATLDIVNLATLTPEGDIVWTGVTISSVTGDIEVTVGLYIDEGGGPGWKRVATTDAVNYPVAGPWPSAADMTILAAGKLSDNAAFSVAPGTKRYVDSSVVLGEELGCVMLAVWTQTSGGAFSFDIDFSFEQPAG